MTRINLTKYGFVRWPEEDFSDDGNRFQCYRAGKKLRVSKLVSDGEVYLCADSECGNGTLPYEVYSKLPSYNKSNWEYNGVQITDLCDADFYDFYDACIAYEQEYEAAEASIQYPTIEEIYDKAVKITEKRMLEIATVEGLLSKYAIEAAARFTPYEWKAVQEYLKNLMAGVTRFNPETFPQTIVGQQYSFTFVKPDCEMGDSYWFTYLRDLFKRYCMN